MPASTSSVPGLPKAMPYLPQLDGVRAVAVLMVFAAHCGFGNVIPGGFGVTIFFFLSGYLITSLLRIERGRTGRVDLKHFYLRRALRILPPMYVALGLTGLLYQAHLLQWFKVDAVAVFGQVAFLTNYPDVLGTEGVLPVPLWSLAIEEHFYLLFPLAFVLWLGSRSPRRAASACLVACVVVLGLRFWNAWRLTDYSWNYSWTHTRIDAILFGCCLGLWNNPVIPSDEAWLPRPWHVASAAALLLLSVLVRNEMVRQTVRYTIQSAALFVVFIPLVSGQGRITRLLSTEILRRIGICSYSFYLLHMAIIAFFQHLLPGARPITLVLVTLLPSLAAAWVMVQAVEKPAARVRRYLTGRKDRAGVSDVVDNRLLAEAVPALGFAKRAEALGSPRP